MQELAGYITTAQAAQILSIAPESAGHLVRTGTIPGVKLANRWLIPKDFVEELAQHYQGKRGRPRKKRMYTKRSPRWSNQ